MYAPTFQFQQVDRKEGYWMCTYGAWSAQTLADPGQTHQLHTHNRRIGSDGIPAGVGGVERRGRQITAGAQTHEIVHPHDNIIGVRAVGSNHCEPRHRSQTRSDEIVFARSLPKSPICWATLLASPSTGGSSRGNSEQQLASDRCIHLRQMQE